MSLHQHSMNRIRILILIVAFPLTVVAGSSTKEFTKEVAIQLHAAVRSKDVNRVQANLALDGKAVNYPAAEKGFSALHFAAEYASSNGLKVLQLLLTHGAKIEAKNIIGQTPLFSAVIHNNPEGVKILIEHGANVNVQQDRGWTPLHWAANNAYCDVAGVLIKYNAAVAIKSSDGKTPLELALEGQDRYKKNGDTNLVKDTKRMIALLLDAENRREAKSGSSRSKKN